MTITTKFMVVLLSWFTPNVGLDLQEFEGGRTMRSCEASMHNISKDWVRNEPEGFGYTIECQLNPEWHPKGKSK